MSARGSLGLFLQQWRRNFTETGALAPSSRALARAMVAHLEPGAGPRRILEAGPGTGVFTEAIVTRMGPLDRLDVFEINPAFADFLEARFRTEPAFLAVQGRLALHRGSVLDLPADAMFESIVSGLPMNNFQPQTVRSLLDSFFGHLMPGGALTYFEYVLVRALKGIIASPEERERLREVGEVTGEFVRCFQVHSEAVLFNLPPAVARRLVKPLHHVQPVTIPAHGLNPAAAIQ